MEPKVVFIDWSQTLSVSKFWEGSKHFPEVDRLLFTENSFLIEPWMRGKLVTEDIVNFLALRLKIPKKILLADLIQSCQQMTFVDPQVEKLVQKLRRKKVRVVIATDNMDSFPRWTVPTLRLRQMFDGVLNSHTLRALKKDFDETGHSLFFRNYLNEGNLGISEAVLVDDSQANCQLFETAGGKAYQARDKNDLLFTLKSL
jgi:FMN phosphatase YigB (HAD superfamily)